VTRVVSNPALGIVAGQGSLPLELARAARRSGRRVVAVAFEELADRGLDAEVDECTWLQLGEIRRILDVLSGSGVREAVLAGNVPKLHLYDEVEDHSADETARAIVEGLDDRRDLSVLGAVADAFAARGICLLPQLELIPELAAPMGPLSSIEATPHQLEDLRFAWPIARELARLDIGQTLVVREKAILAVEAIDGTDATLRRGGELGRGGASAVKVARPSQDPRFELPVIGPSTVDALAAAGIGAMVVEAGRTIVLEPDATAAKAEAHGVVLLAWPPSGCSAMDGRSGASVDTEESR